MKCENKRRFVSGLGDLLMLYSRERVVRIDYVTEEKEEFAVIRFAGGIRKVMITGDSCTAIMQDIAGALL